MTYIFFSAKGPFILVVLTIPDCASLCNCHGTCMQIVTATVSAATVAVTVKLSWLQLQEWNCTTAHSLQTAHLHTWEDFANFKKNRRFQIVFSFTSPLEMMNNLTIQYFSDGLV